MSYVPASTARLEDLLAELGINLSEFIASSAFVALVAGVLALYVLLIVAWWRIFRKAGHCGIWSLVPVVSLFMYVHIAAGSAWKTLLLLIPFFGPVYGIILNFKLAHAFGHRAGFGFGLWLLPNVFTLILAFDKSRYLR